MAGVLIASLLGPQATAQAIPSPGDVLGGLTSKAGFDCKEAPAAQMPAEPQEAWFDEQSRNRTKNGDSSHVYEVYGWAGLSWHTYDLGCGPDLLRSSDAVADTKTGNTLLSIGKYAMAIAFWLDDQAASPEEAQARGITPMWKHLDNIVTAAASTLRLGVFQPWVGVTLMLCAAVAGWRAMQKNSAGVAKGVILAGAMLTLGALFVGAPQKAIQVSDDTFSALITTTQGSMFKSAGLSQDPRNVLIDNVLMPDIYKGWFGASHRPNTPAGRDIDKKLLESLAFSYDEQRELTKPDGSIDGEKASKKVAEKQQQFSSLAKALSESDVRAYQQFQGKDSSRTSTGALSMLKVGAPSLIWSGGSLLKIMALMVIRFAILFAAIWVPWVAVSVGLLERVFRIIFGAWLWGIAAAGILSIYLIVLVKLYSDTAPGIDGAWRLWMMLLLTIVAWSIMRPFKRMSNLARQDGSSLASKAFHRGPRGKTRKIYEASKWAGGPIQGVAESLGDNIGDATDPSSQHDDVGTASTWRPEGAYDRRRRSQGRTNRDYSTREDLHTESRKSDLYTSGDNDPTDAPIVIEGQVISSSMSNSDEPRRLSGGRHARLQATPVRAPAVWDGGEESPLAPVRLYRPSQDEDKGAADPRHRAVSAKVAPVANAAIVVAAATHKPGIAKAAVATKTAARVWDDRNSRRLTSG